jgi:hypothetical protein
VASRTLQVGDVKFAVRSTSEPFIDWVDLVFSDHILDEELKAYYSIVVPEEQQGAVRSVKEFSILYRGSATVLRSLHVPSVAEAFLKEVESLSFFERDDAIYAAVLPVQSNGTTAIVPETIVSALGSLGRKVRRAKISLPIPGAVAIDPDTGRLVPPPVHLDLPADALDRLSQFVPAGGEGDRTRVDGPVDPDLILVWSWEPSEMALVPVSRARAVHALTQLILNLDKVGQSALDALANMVSNARVYGIRNGSPEQNLDTVKTALRA